jgi:hypothetical protein
MGLTIGTVVISYDVDKLHTAVKEEMVKLGYYDNWRYGNQKTYKMPNTTLWHQQKSSDAAVNDLKNTCKTLNVKLDKAVAVLAEEFAGI